MKILIVWSDQNCSCTEKNTFQLSRCLNKRLYCKTLYYTHLKEHHFKTYDLILLQRLGGNGVPIPSNYLKYIEYANKIYPNKIFYLLDDLLLERPQVFEFMKQCAGVIVTSSHYVKYVRDYNRNIHYYTTFVDDELIDFIEPAVLDKSKVNLVYASTGNLGSDFLNILTSVLNYKLKNIEVHAFGGDQSRYSSLIKYHPISPEEELISYIKASDFMINLIFDCGRGEDFLKCKSPLKFALASLCKTPIISSNKEPYSDFIKDNYDGFLVENDLDVWVNKIESLLKDKEKVNQVTQQAYQTGLKNFTFQVKAQDMVDLFNQIKSS